MELIQPRHPQDIALIDGDQNTAFTYHDLHHRITQLSLTFNERKALAFLFIRPTIDHVIAYLTLLQSNHAVAVFDSALNPMLKARLVEQYHPQFIIGESLSSTDYTNISSPSVSLLPILKAVTPGTPVHPDLQLLLSTSGTTGSPKLIRLSKKNLLSNAHAIVNYLNLTSTEKAIASLSFSYSYGLSVLHSHLMAGACMILTSHSVVQQNFWTTAQEHGCTSMAGVPYTYELLDRLGIENLLPSSLKTLTQAGGRLDPLITLKLHQLMAARQGKFYPMYGQTEATARIAYLPPNFLPEKAGAIGIPIPGGKLQLFTGEQEVKESNKEGELVYTGDNVMMGYATNPSDLTLGDQLHGRLHTGDIGYKDDDGIYFLTGRLKRISKIYGQRINLDDVEAALSTYGRVAATSDDVTIRLYFESPNTNIEDCPLILSKLFHLSPTAFECILLPLLPLTVSGKIDYMQLKGSNEHD